MNKRIHLLGKAGVALLLLSASAVHADISGKIFRDFNANGTADTNEPGEANVTVKAFAPDGSQATSTTSGTDGSYTLSISSGTDYRIEFSWANATLKSGVGGGTSVQFVQNGATNVNFAINNPAQVIAPGSSPQIATAVQSGSIHYGSEFVLTKLANTVGSTAAAMSSYMTPTPTVLAQEDQIGSIWGVAHDRANQRLLAGAFIKRFARLAGNPTTIYSVPENSGTPTPWVTLDASRADPHGSSPDWSQDFTVISDVGKDGLGDVDIAEDGSEVYTVDLKTREFVRIPVNADGSAGTPVKIALPTTLSNCTVSGDVRPMGLGVHDGKVYVGAVCSAESTVSGLPIAGNAARVGDPSALRGYVLEWDGSNSFSTLLNFKLDYERGCLNAAGGAVDCSTAYGNAAWQAWTPDYPFSSWSPPNGNGYPQPMISDIDFTGDGSMVLGLLDRFGHMDGSYAVEPPSSSFSSGQLTISGDTLHACKTGTGWVMEKQISGDAGCSTAGLGYDSNRAKTIDEYYYEDDMGDAAVGNHADVGEGGIGVLWDSDTVISSVMDPARSATNNDVGDPWESHGLHWYNSDGSWQKGYVLVDQGQPNDMPIWGKGNGLGDVEILYPPAPIEIGNRVWLDTDGDGIQDAGEAGIPGVSVELLDGSGTTPIATVTTDASGTYYFSNATGTDTGNKKYGLTVLTPNTAYTVRFPTTVTVSGTDYSLTSATSGSNTLIDSNAPASGDVAVTATDIPVAGANNHSFDVGYAAAPPACSINMPTVSATCNNSGTPSDPSDDTFTYTINATGTGVGATYSISGGDTQTGLSYGTDHVSTNSFPISGGGLTLTLTDDATTSCTLGSVTVTAPSTCSSTAPTVDLEITKVADKSTANSGDTVRYTITLKNKGPNTATGVEVTDQLPTGVTYTTHVASKGTYSPGSGIWTVGDMVKDATETLTIDVTVD